jgi:hypothetical protein
MAGRGIAPLSILVGTPTAQSIFPSANPSERAVNRFQRSTVVPLALLPDTHCNRSEKHIRMDRFVWVLLTPR